MIFKCFTKDTHGKVIAGISGGYNNIIFLLGEGAAGQGARTVNAAAQFVSLVVRPVRKSAPIAERGGYHIFTVSPDLFGEVEQSGVTSSDAV